MKHSLIIDRSDLNLQRATTNINNWSFRALLAIILVLLNSVCFGGELTHPAFPQTENATNIFGGNMPKKTGRGKAAKVNETNCNTTSKKKHYKEAMMTQNILAKEFSEKISVKRIYLQIKNGEYKEQIDKVRLAKNLKEKTSLKKKLPAFTLGLSKDLKRKSDAFRMSKYFVLDIDKVGGSKKLSSLRLKVIEDPFTHMVFISPSGNGLKIVYKLSRYIEDPDEFSRAYKMFAKMKGEQYGCKPDSTSDCLRLCFVSYDPEAYFNEESEEVDIASLLVKREHEKPESTKVKKQVVAESHNDFLSEMLEFLSKQNISYNDWIKIGFYLATVPSGEDLFLKMSLENPHFDDTEESIRSKYENLHKECDGESYSPTIYSVLKICKQLGFNPQNFYTVDDKGKVKLSKTDFVENLLPYLGYYRDSNDNLIQVNDNVLTQVNVRTLKREVLDYFNSLDVSHETKDQLKNNLMYSSAFNFSRHILDFLQVWNGTTMSYYEDTINLFYRNRVWVKIAEDNVQYKSFDDMPYPVKASDIIDRDIKEASFDEEFEFYEFLRLVSAVKKPDGKFYYSKNRLRALTTSMAYLVDMYKDRSNAKAVVFTDDFDEAQLEGRANGGNGKSICTKAITYMSNSKYVSGRNIKSDNRFKFQQVDTSTRLVAINDLTKGFDFTCLYDILTEDMEIEFKGQKSMVIDFKNSPKLLLSTNYVLGKNEHSTTRRIHEVVFSHYFNENRSPLDKFTKVFFDDWNSEDWLKFDTMMIKFCQDYMKTGLVKVEYDESRVNLIKQTIYAFMLFAEDLELNERYDKNELFNQYVASSPLVKGITKNMFKKYLDRYAKIMGFIADHKKSNGNNYVTFYSNETDAEANNIEGIEVIDIDGFD